LALGLYYNTMVQRYMFMVDVYVSRVGLLFEKDLNHGDFFLRYRAQAEQFKTFLGFKPTSKTAVQK
jgi:hypothetical protein